MKLINIMVDDSLYYFLLRNSGGNINDFVNTLLKDTKEYKNFEKEIMEIFKNIKNLRKENKYFNYIIKKLFKLEIFFVERENLIDFKNFINKIYDKNLLIFLKEKVASCDYNVDDLKIIINNRIMML